MAQNENMGLTPKQIVSELDRYIIGQYNAKKMVAIALRNRSRRKNLPTELRDEVLPKNIIMIGPTGVGKTEIARRLSRLAGAPFIKVEASKYTEVGYVGRDVESMVRDLADVGVNIVREEKTAEVLDKAKANAEHKLLDLLLPPPPGISSSVVKKAGKEEIVYDIPREVEGEEMTPHQKWLRNREKMKKQLADGKLEERQVEIETAAPKGPMVSGFSFGGSGEEMGIELKGLFDKIMPSQKKKMKIPISEAREVLTEEEVENLLDMDKIIREGLDRSQESGIIFIDEIDKIAGKTSTHGPDVSREGVQRDILPIVEGSTVFTKYGMVKTDHILFIAAGAFHTSKPSDLIPEIQGRFPLRVELDDLGPDEFKRILTEPENALTRQYQELLKTDGVKIDYTDNGIEEIAQSAYKVNQNTENIGARRLYTVMEKIFEEISFEAPDTKKKHLTIDAEYVLEKIKDIVKDQDLSKFIL